jgi:hypothetical protein
VDFNKKFVLGVNIQQVVVNCPLLPKFQKYYANPSLYSECLEGNGYTVK